MIAKYCVFFTLFLICQSVSYTGNGQPKFEETHSLGGTHRVSFGLGHTSISQGRQAGQTQWLPLASWSLNYDYWISDKWAFGIQNDIILEVFKVIQKSDNMIIERKNPLAVIPVGIYKISPSWSVIGGAGIEFSSGHNLGLTRIGTEFGLHIPKQWEVGIALVWDNKWNYYNSWGIAFTFSKLFKRH